MPAPLDKSPFTYVFCWHAEPEFVVWHRGLMAEFERLMQKNEPTADADFPEGSTRHTGPGALGAPYWAWEKWEGLTLPSAFTEPTYTVMGNKYAPSYPSGTTFAKPYCRWFAPVSVADQKREYFPPTLDDSNCTTRAKGFTSPTVPFEYRFNYVTEDPGSPAASDSINAAISQPNFYQFGTVKDPVTSKHTNVWSIENPHNMFHNHIGGIYTVGGIMGPGKQPFGDLKGGLFYSGI